jgi:lysophospholipase L1-like esterase
MPAVLALFVGAMIVLFGGIHWLNRPPAYTAPVVAAAPQPPAPAPAVAAVAEPPSATVAPPPLTLAEKLRQPPDRDLFPANEAAVPEDPGLGMPERLVLDAVVGEEFRFYFDNLGFFHDMDRTRIFASCTCSFGRIERRSWGGTPRASDVGEHVVSWTVNDGQGQLIREYELTIRVAPRAPAKLPQLRAFFLGDSITRQQFWANFVYDNLRAHVANEVTTFGRVHFPNEPPGTYRASSRSGLRSESYNGWPTFWYLNENFQHFPAINPESDVSRSPFWFGPSLSEGELSFTRFVAAHGEGRMPDVVFIMLGTNDSSLSAFAPWAAELTTMNAVRSLERIFALLRADRPDMQIFVVNPPPTSHSASAWLTNYGEPSAFQSPLSMKYHMRWMAGAYEKAFSKREGEGIHYIPAHIGMDPIDGYHLEQVVHPSEFGHRQVANSINAYLNRWLANGAGGLAARN